MIHYDSFDSFLLSLYLIKSASKSSKKKSLSRFPVASSLLAQDSLQRLGLVASRVELRTESGLVGVNPKMVGETPTISMGFDPTKKW